jgi:RNA polymerase sigma-70 factor (ECF subfamily)
MGNPHNHLEELYFQQRRQLFTCALAVTRCPELAEDAIHDAFCRLAAGHPDGVENLKAYVFRAVRNAAVDLLRRRARPLDPLDESVFDPGPGPGELASQGEFRERVAAALSQLKGDERETIIQHLWGELTFREIAQIRGAPPGTVTAWYRRGLARLRELLEEVRTGTF